MMLGSLSTTATAETRPLMPAGPMLLASMADSSEGSTWADAVDATPTTKLNAKNVALIFVNSASGSMRTISSDGGHASSEGNLAYPLLSSPA